MYRIRPIQISDLDALVRLAESAAPGLTTLPKDRNYLKAKIDDSLRAFDDKVRKPGSEAYIFVLEDVNTRHIHGTSGILAKIGGFDPFFTYKIEYEDYRDQKLGVDKKIGLLHLKTYHNGPSEICSLFLDSALRKTGYGRLLSLSRFQFIASFQERFEKQIISELRGVSDDAGHSPFWECVGRHFFDSDFSFADNLSGLGQKEFIMNLMPKYPVYIPMLPKSVQCIIGKVHPRTEPALHMLEKEGFQFQHEVDIFDAGPTIGCDVKVVRCIRESHVAKTRQSTGEIFDHRLYLVSNQRLDFRCCLARLEISGSNEVVLSPDVLNALEIKPGDQVRYALAKPEGVA